MNYTWNEIFERANNKAYGSEELVAKDTAREHIRSVIKEYTGRDVETDESPEEIIEQFTLNIKVLFDIRGNVVNIDVSSYDAEALEQSWRITSEHWNEEDAQEWLVNEREYRDRHRIEEPITLSVEQVLYIISELMETQNI